MIKIEKINDINESHPDDAFITCASFEERCLGSLQKFDNYFSDRVIIFNFEEENPARDKNIQSMIELLSLAGLQDKCHRIFVKHGMTTDGILKLHNYFKNNNLLKPPDKQRYITLDITTFTKEFLFELLFYLVDIMKVENLRFLYTIPDKYAAPDEGPLSHGIKNIKIVPFFWNKWSATKDDMLMIVLGYEEMRAWSLISRFDANINRLFITTPGSKPDWDTHCQAYNKRLLNENYKRDTIPALDPVSIMKILKRQIVDDKLYDKYNLFIAPLGTKPQVIGIFYFLNKYPEANVNIVSTTAIEHNTPYYSWGVGESYCFFATDLQGLKR